MTDRPDKREDVARYLKFASAAELWRELGGRTVGAVLVFDQRPAGGPTQTRVLTNGSPAHVSGLLEAALEGLAAFHVRQHGGPPRGDDTEISNDGMDHGGG